MVVRHSWLFLDYTLAISYRLGFLPSPSLEAYTGLKPIMRYGLMMGNRFFLMRDEVTEDLYICSAIRPFRFG